MLAIRFISMSSWRTIRHQSLALALHGAVSKRVLLSGIFYQLQLSSSWQWKLYSTAAFQLACRQALKACMCCQTGLQKHSGRQLQAALGHDHRRAQAVEPCAGML